MILTNIFIIGGDYMKLKNTNLSLGGIISGGFKIGFQNWGRLILVCLLFALICWVPYLNIGCTIGLTGIIVMLSKGQKASATSIFNSYYLKKMGDVALLNFLYLGGIIGLVLILANISPYLILTGIPALFVLFISWSMSNLLLLDKDIGALKSIELSNEITYGYKGLIFGVGIINFLLIVLTGGILGGIFFGIGINISSENGIIALIIFAVIIGIVFYTFIMAYMFGIAAIIYKGLEQRLSIESYPLFFNAESNISNLPVQESSE